MRYRYDCCPARLRGRSGWRSKSAATALAALTALMLFAAPLRCGGAPVDAARDAEAAGGEWSSYGRTYTEDHFSPLSQINRQDVGRLGLAWYRDLDTSDRTDSQPIEADGFVYIATGLSIVQALDAATGRPVWIYDPAVGLVAGRKLRASWGIRGLALADGRIFVGTQDGRLIALDAKTGKADWSVMTLKRSDETTITGAPRVFNGTVCIGFAGGDRGGTRGALNCFDAQSGRKRWRFFTVPGDPARGFRSRAMRMAAATWSGEWWRYGGGGAVWNAITYDADLNRVYIGTGNGDPWNPAIRNPRGLDNLFLSSIVALDAKTGRYIWHYQENPNDAWDFDATEDIELATLPIAGHSRRVLLQASKNGFLYVIDRDTGRIISAGKLGRVTWAKRIDLITGRPVENRGIRYYSNPVEIWPGYFGLHNWPPMSFSPNDRLLFIPVIRMSSYYSAQGVNPRKWTPERNSWTTGLAGDEGRLPIREFGSGLLAWNPVTQKKVWKVTTAGLWAGGTMATAGELVFQGQLDGSFDAYDSRTGRKLWTYHAGAAVTGAPISFSYHGIQYVTVLAGPPSGQASNQPGAERFGWTYRATPRRVLTFAIGGVAVLPRSPSVQRHIQRRSRASVDLGMARRGGRLYASNCSHCHGPDVVSGGAAPDLRASPVPEHREAFRRVVQEGLLIREGMPQFRELTNADLDQIRMFIQSREP